MTGLKTDVDLLLRDVPSWARLAKKSKLRMCFRKAMSGRAYGFEALSDAWTWFALGWGAHMHEGEQNE